jgi:alpha-glucosidase
MIYQWREVLDEWKTKHNTESKIMMTEAYANTSSIIRKYYKSEDGMRNGSHMPFNFLMISQLSVNSTAPDYVNTINQWWLSMPVGQTANWVLGNHDTFRVGSKYGDQRIDAMTLLLMTLPGVAVTYNVSALALRFLTHIELF